MAQPFQAPLDAMANTIAVSAVQSATIVSEIGRKLDHWMAAKRATTVVVPGIPDVSILQGGSVWWCRGHALPSSRVVASLGAMLASLLDHTATHRAPAGLLYVVARATDPRHLAPLTDLSEFHKTLARYAAARPSVAMDALVAKYAVACSGLPALGVESTISDVRRLRRASGVPLAQVAADTAIPVSLLRELEWGVYTHWNLEHARGALELYAERAGLDPDAVARVIEHEQTLGLPAEEHLLEPAALPEFGAASSERRALPFALAAFMVGTVLLTVPGDRSPRSGTAHAATRESVPPEHSALALPASDQPMRPGGSEPHLAPAVNAVPRLSRQVSAVSRQKAPVRSTHAHPLLKLARAITGDGKYKVEPFPKMKDER